MSSDPIVAIGASVTSFLGTLGLATHALPVPSTVPEWLPYVSTILGPVLVVIVNKLLAGKSAQERSIAAAKEKRAADLLADGKPENDGEARRLQDEADSARAVADALDAAKGK